MPGVPLRTLRGVDPYRPLMWPIRDFVLFANKKQKGLVSVHKIHYTFYSYDMLSKTISADNI